MVFHVLAYRVIRSGVRTWRIVLDPKVLIITCRRNIFIDFDKPVALHRDITYPESLELKKVEGENFQVVTYKLLGVVAGCNVKEAKHSFTFVKMEETYRWYNDLTVTSVNFQEVKKWPWLLLVYVRV
ncbi:unnamed protein product [Larinioides sclopetarius]|uniref:USP domain-containing protein n=1 Tax=Larinioides sclopetarius TaxID=280406 RepID=A0AAV1Z9G7_9ARAC